MKKVNDFVEMTAYSFNTWAERMIGTESRSKWRKNPDGTPYVYTYTACRKHIDEEYEKASNFLSMLYIHDFCSKSVADNAEEKLSESYEKALSVLFKTAIDKGLPVVL